MRPSLHQLRPFLAALREPIEINAASNTAPMLPTPNKLLRFRRTPVREEIATPFSNSRMRGFTSRAAAMGRHS